MARGRISLFLVLSLTLSGCTMPFPAAQSSLPAPSQSVAAAPESTESAITEQDSSAEPSSTSSVTPSEQPVEAVSGTPEDSVLEYLLSSLEIESEFPSGYDRDFFDHWIDADGDGCNTRREVLAQESITRVSIGPRCDVRGEWWSAFDGVRTTDQGDFDVDHMVPLKEAWDSGAYEWDYRTRRAFANDLGFSGSLIAVSASSNRSKSDKDPAQWLPANRGFSCEYTFDWLAVKYRWSLSVDSAEALALGRLVANCQDEEFPPLPEKASIVLGAPRVESDSAGDDSNQLDPRFGTCREAIANGYGEYVRGQDPEYDWYRDGDGDGIACE
jgi:hypothetical protein